MGADQPVKTQQDKASAVRQMQGRRLTLESFAQKPQVASGNANYFVKRSVGFITQLFSRASARQNAKLPTTPSRHAGPRDPSPRYNLARKKTMNDNGVSP